MPEPPPPQPREGARGSAGGRLPRQRATALYYQPGQRAPRVVASGAGLIAEQIVGRARAAGVAVRSDPALSEALSALQLGDEVPPELYTAVAVTLAWAYRLDSAKAAKARPPR